MLVLAGLGATLAAGGFFIARHIYEAELPPVEAVRELPLQVPLRILTRDGKLIGEFGAERRDPLDYAELPETLVQAFIAAEDARFFAHPGVDWRCLLRAAVNLVRTGERSQGGSTITMQLARNYFLTRERTYDRKIREIFLALRMEEVLSKQQIMESYLNKIYLGERAYGVGAAARVYFDVPVDELSVSQMAVLAGLPKAPSRDNPVNDPERALERRNYVLDRMRALDFITPEEYETARAAPVVVTPEKVAVDIDAHYVAEMVRQEMVARHGDAVYTDGYTVTTTIDSRQQRAAVASVREHLRAHSARQGYASDRPMIDAALRDALDETPLPEAVVAAIETFDDYPDLTRALVLAHDADGMRLVTTEHGRVTLAPDDYAWARLGDQRLPRGSVVHIIDRSRDAAAEADGIALTGDDAARNPPDWRLAAEPIAQAALVALDPRSGAITALVGGYDFFAGRFNRATQAERQPGSAIKPIIYAAAFDQGYTPASIIIDAPIVMEDYALEDKWRPRNYTGRFYGPTRLREALVHSRNIVSIKLLRAIGVETARDYLPRFGLPLERVPDNLSLALGSPVFTPLEMARAFAVFANGGHLVEPYHIADIEHLNAEPDAPRTLPEEIAAIAAAAGVAAPGEMAPEDAAARRPLPLCDNPMPATFAIRAREEAEAEAAEALAGADFPLGEPEPAPEPEPTLEPVPTDAIAQCIPRTVNDRVAWEAADLMRDVVRRGTGARATELGRNDLAGKTGTTNDEADAWFVGFQRELAAAVWVGHDQPRRLGRGEGGARAALPIWIDFMRVALDGREQAIPPRPEGMVDVRIDPDSGLLAHPEATSVVFETLPEELVPEMTSEQNGGEGGSALDALY